MKAKRFAAACAFVATLPLAASAQSNIRNADLQERPAGDLARTVQQLSGHAGPYWIAYAVPAERPDWNACCWDNWGGSDACCGRCSLEERGKGKQEVRTTAAPGGAVQLEGSASAIVLYRVENGRIGKVRAFSDSCAIDAGGRTVYWLTGVQPAASIAVLKALVESTAMAEGDAVRRHVVGEGLVAISAHAAREGIAALLDMARNGRAPRVRSESLFWLAQRAGSQAAGTITDAIANDPDTKVKERAVFALSQLPEHEGVPKLIEVARTNRNPRVRQQAVFWLGQSKDPRALRFFEEILLK